MKSLFVVIAAVGLALAGCGKEEEAAARPTPAAATFEEYVRVKASHAEPKPNDPVLVSIPRFAVVAADFDPQQVEGGTATIELDLSSLTSGSAKRDKHLTSDDYLHTSEFAKATIAVSNVKKTGERTYSADARVTARGVEKTLPVTFEVVETLSDGIRIRGAHTFARLDFGIGQPPGPDDSAAEQVTIELALTIRRT